MLLLVRYLALPCLFCPPAFGSVLGEQHAAFPLLLLHRSPLFPTDLTGRNTFRQGVEGQTRCFLCCGYRVVICLFRVQSDSDAVGLYGQSLMLSHSGSAGPRGCARVGRRSTAAYACSKPKSRSPCYHGQSSRLPHHLLSISTEICWHNCPSNVKQRRTNNKASKPPWFHSISYLVGQPIPSSSPSPCRRNAPFSSIH